MPTRKVSAKQVRAAFVSRIREHHDGRVAKPIALCERCKEPFVRSRRNHRFCPPCGTAAQRQVAWKRNNSAAGLWSHKKYRNSDKGLAKREQWRRANPDKVRASWIKANEKRKSPPEIRICLTLLCGATFIVAGVAKARRMFCDDCRDANGYRRDRRRSA